MYFPVVSTLHHPQQRDIALESVLAALGDATRLAIVARLDSQEEITCGCMGIDLPKSTASHHYRVLREAGVVRTRQEGTSRYMSLRRKELDARFPGLLQAVLKGAKTG